MPSKKYTLTATTMALSGILLSRNLAAANANILLLPLGLLMLANNLSASKSSSALMTYYIPPEIGYRPYHNAMVKGIVTLAGFYCLGKYAKAFQLTGKLTGMLEKIPGVKRFANLDKPYAIGLILLGLLINAAIANREEFFGKKAVVSFDAPKGSKGGSLTEFVGATAKSFFTQLNLGRHTE